MREILRRNQSRWLRKRPPFRCTDARIRCRAEKIPFARAASIRFPSAPPRPMQWKSVQKYRDGLTVDAFGLSSGQATVAKMVPASVLRRQLASAKNMRTPGCRELRLQSRDAVQHTFATPP